MNNNRKIIYYCFVICFSVITISKAEIFVVTNSNSSGAGSLMQAVEDVNALSGQDTILFAANVRGTINNYGTIRLTDGLVMIGPGPDLLAISANQNGRVVYIDYCYNKNFYFEGLTFKDGRTTTFAGAGLCGVADTIIVIDCIIKDNESVYANSGGGGIALWSTYLYMENCLIYNNKSRGCGAGMSIGSGSTVIVRNSSVCNNLITGNAFFGGGAIYNAGYLYMENCTISGNTHPIRGGAINVYGFLNLNNCTITNNFADNCGGIYEASASTEDTVVVLANSIIGGNSTNSGGKDLYGKIYSRGYNLIQDQTGATILGDITGNIYGQDPLLGALQSYSSTVMFHPLLTGSPAIDSGNNQTCLATDQRGIYRPQDGNEDGNAVADIGAIEKMIDSDDDGISDLEEQGPNGNDPAYDGNNDGIPDHTQSNVASFWNYNDEYYLTIAVPAGYKLINVRAIDNPSPANVPPGLEFPVGFFSFIIDLQGNAGPVTVTMYLPQGVVITDYYKYGQTPVLPMPHWYQFMYDSQTGAEIIQPNIINLHFIDGERGDNDITVNGYIVEPGGPVGSASDVDDEITLPFTFKLEQNYPNPFNPSTRIQYQVPSITRVFLKVYDILGNEIATLVNEEKPAGSYEVEFSASNGLASGIYFYQLKATPILPGGRQVGGQAGKFIETKKMLLVK